MLLAASVFEKSEWAAFAELLPDLNYISCFGCTGSGSAEHEVASITPSSCLFFVQGTTVLHKALWAGAPSDVIRAIVAKGKEDPMKRNMASVFSTDETFIPLHVAAGACDDVALVETIASMYEPGVFAKEGDGHMPIDILRLGGHIEGLPERVNTKMIETLLVNLARVSKCNSCYKKIGTEGVALKKCGACKCVAYCSLECQKSDWKMHKKSCKQMKVASEPVKVDEEVYELDSEGNMVTPGKE